MKSIAAAASILMLTASAFAAEPQKPQTDTDEKYSGPIVLTAAQLDGVTAGEGFFLKCEGVSSENDEVYVAVTLIEAQVSR